ncbi:MAG: MFS transporter [Acidobacteria bacterium CG_4_9_14_3_um_filter_49_7]|nr:MAG: MFS transporter [Acidobacteria bacterium CG_4_9_14_3_um_filter_49_7]
MFEHTKEFRIRRFLNWFPLGLAYAFLYMGRYNLTVSKIALGNIMTKEDFGIIFGIGTITYAVSFLINGPLTDKIGGRKGMLIAVLGASVMNLLMGQYISTVNAATVQVHHIRTVFSILYAANMYFQSYGALSIVKVNAHWFHVNERGGFSGIFGTMISSGIFFAFTVNGWILSFATSGGASMVSEAKVVFFVPAAILFFMFVVEFFILRDRPALAGLEDFDTGDASSGEEGIDIPILKIMKRIITNPIILTIAFVEFCTGVLRNGIMHWFPIYVKEVMHLPSHHWLRNGSWADWPVVAAVFAAGIILFLLAIKADGKRRATLLISGALVVLAPFLMAGWGGILMVAGVIGGNVAGWVSDIFFDSRRAPAAGGLYGLLAVVLLFMFFTMSHVWALGVVVFIVSTCVIGTHGLMSGTATMDFGGTKGAATAVGMIDGFVYLGTGVQSFALGWITTHNWHWWPLFLLPFALIGFYLLTRIWNKKPMPKGAH